MIYSSTETVLGVLVLCFRVEPLHLPKFLFRHMYLQARVKDTASMENKIFTPYRVCPLGAHVDHQHGPVTGFAINKGVSLEFDVTDSGEVNLISKNYPGNTFFHVSDTPERELTWGDFARGAAIALSRKYRLKRGIRGTVEGTLPVGGLSSSAAVIITYIHAFCIANHIHITKPEMISTAIWTEHNYIGVKVGKLDQSCEVYCKKNSLLYLDTKDDSTEIIPIDTAMPPFEIMTIFSGLERSLAGSLYNARVDECKAAAYCLMAHSGMEYGKFQDAVLRDVPLGIFKEYEDCLPENWRKRARHFYSEKRRVRDGVTAWRSGNLQKFGQLIFESGRSSIENYETGSRELIVLHEIMESTSGIYGGRFSGAGFNGSSIALIDPQRKEDIAGNVLERYLKVFPNLKNKVSVHFCTTADGVSLS